tara:strand:+ start:1114 stop:1614 length:501 start_codon:yes stop_codon:yes gene_type:complete
LISLAWNVLYTKTKNEKKVFKSLSNLGIDAYCPCQRTLKQWSDRKKWVDEPVFKSYIFVKVPESESQKLQILNTPGVVRFLYWLGKPAQVRQVEIDGIRSFLGEHQSVESISFDAGSKLNVKQGVLKGSEGVVLYQTKNEVVLSVEKLGMSLVARLPKVSVEGLNL